MNLREATITFNYRADYCDNTYKNEYSADGMLCRTTVISSEGDPEVTEYDHQGDRVNVSYYYNGEQTGEGTCIAEDGKLLRVEVRYYEPGADSYYEQVSVYTYREDGSYMLETTQTFLDERLRILAEFDGENRLVSREIVQTYEDGDDYSNTTYEYDDAGNMLRWDQYEYDAEGEENTALNMKKLKASGKRWRRAK